MTLVLSVVSYAGRTPPVPLTMVFAHRGGAIGRQPGCDWVLDDPEGHVSKRHGSIDYVGGQYRITDTSTNGLFLNGSGQLIGRGASAVLQDGDRLYLGRYVIDVEIAAGALDSTEGTTAPTEPPGPAEPAPAPAPVIAAPAERHEAPADPVEPAKDPVRVAEPEYDLLQLRGTRRVERGAAGGTSAMDLVQAFLEGAGLSTELMDQAEPEIVLHAAGASLKALVAGLRRLIRNRVEIKAALKLNGAAAASDDAFARAPSNEAALLTLLNPAGPGAPAPEVAIERGVDLLEARELALLEEARRAIAEAMAALEPAALLARIEGRSLLAASKKAKGWDLFEAEYKKLNESGAASDDARSPAAPIAEH